jgi:hypothetical protein
VVVELTEAGSQLAEEAPSPLHERFRCELAELREWEQTTILATLQRIASMMDAEDIEAIPVLGSGVAGASEEDVSRYLEKAIVATGEARVTEEPQATTTVLSEREPPRREEPMGVQEPRVYGC